MKKTIGVLAICATLTMLAASAFANAIPQTQTKPATPAATPAAAPAAAQGACNDDAKAAWYADFTANRTKDVKLAYEAGKKYLTNCPQETGQIPDYLKKWVAAYEREERSIRLTRLFYGEKKYPEALALGKEILAEDPENPRVIIDMGYGAYLAAATLKNESYNADALSYMRKAIQLIESGKAPEKWAPFKDKDDTLAYLYNSIGRITLKSAPTDALNALVKSVQLESELKKDPWTYYFIGTAYETGSYVKLSADYKARFEGKDETPESKLALANVQQVIDRMVDAYARAVSLAGSDPKYQATKPEWMETLTTWYKYRHNDSPAGLTEMIAGVLSKPLPPVPTPITTLPDAPATTTTPATGTTTSGGSSAAGGAAAAPSTTKPATPATAPASTAPKTTPTSTPEPTPAKPPTKPKTRKNHKNH